MKSKSEVMKKNILIIVLGICMLITSALPYFGKELFVSKTGHIDHMNLVTVVLLIAGTWLNWKYIYEIINGLFLLYLIVIIIFIGSHALISPEFLKPGYYLLGTDLLLIIILTRVIKRMEKRMAPERS